jgi:dienelactone hydrolase
MAKNTFSFVFALAVGVIPLVSAGRPKDFAEQLRALDLKKANLLPENPTQAWAKEQRTRQEAVNQEDLKAWNRIQTRADWEKFKTPRIQALRASLGRMPAPPANVPVHITKKIAGAGLFVENLVYESRPGLWVTANLYAPEKPRPKMPGILIVTSHHNPKTQGELQDMGMTWARLGCLVLIPDQLGHGERRQHPFTDASKYPEAFKVGRQDYYFRYNVALQLHLVGESLIGWMVWDMMRGVDVLLAKPGIDKDAIVLLGSVAGGGDPAAVTAALDPRISAVAPFNFGGPQPETKYPLPDDAETSFNYMGGGSWESTRNLRLSGKDRFLPWLIVGSVAPRGLVYGHEFSWDQKRDPVWARLQKIYGFYDAEKHLAFAHGRGLLSGQPPEATHCNNIGPVHRKAIHAALKLWFGVPEPDKETQARLPAADLTCWTDDLKAKLKPKMVWELASQIAAQRLAEARQHRAAGGDQAVHLRKELKRLLGDIDPNDRRTALTLHESPFHFECGKPLHGMGFHLFIPPAKERKYPVVVAFALEGPQAFLKQRAKEIAALHEQGLGVCLAEFRGMGIATSARGRASTSTALSATELMLGEPVLGAQLDDLLTLVMQLRKRNDVDGDRIALWADSFASVNPEETNFAVPLDAARLPAQAEPGSGLLALYGALFDARIKAVYGRGGLVSYASMLQSQFVYLPHDAVLPGALTVADCEDLARALVPRAVRLEGLVDGMNRAASAEQIAQTYGVTRSAYKMEGAAGRFGAHATIGEAEAVARWLSSELRK